MCGVDGYEPLLAVKAGVIGSGDAICAAAWQAILERSFNESEVTEYPANGGRPMNRLKWFAERVLRVALGAMTIWVIGHAGLVLADEISVTLSGSQEIPPVTTSATGTGTLTVGPDRSISGKVTISGMAATVAHIHDAPAGGNGPIVIPLTKTADGVWTVPAGARLTDAQYDAYKAGRLYFNIHSEANKSGEIRGQIKP